MPSLESRNWKNSDGSLRVARQFEGSGGTDCDDGGGYNRSGERAKRGGADRTRTWRQEGSVSRIDSALRAHVVPDGVFDCEKRHGRGRVRAGRGCKRLSESGEVSRRLEVQHVAGDDCSE